MAGRDAWKERERAGEDRRRAVDDRMRAARLGRWMGERLRKGSGGGQEPIERSGAAQLDPHRLDSREVVHASNSTRLHSDQPPHSSPSLARHAPPRHEHCVDWSVQPSHAGLVFASIADGSATVAQTAR